MVRYLTLFIAVFLSACNANKTAPSDSFLSPISDQTLEVIGDAHFGLQLADSIELAHYLNGDTPKVDAWSVQFNHIVFTVQAIAYYSIDLIDIVDAAEGPEAIEPLITSIIRLDAETQPLPGVISSDRNLDEITRSMRNQDNITSAISMTQPVVADITETVTDALVAADQALDEAVIEIHNLILAKHGPMLAYSDDLSVRQNSILKQLSLIDRVLAGDDDAWTELLASDWALSAEIGENSRLTPARARQAEQYLLDRLGTTATIRQQLEPTVIDYRNEMLELYQIEEESKSTLRMALLIVENWDKAHRQLAKGERSSFVKYSSSLMKVVFSQASRKIGR